ncbi:MAG: DUF4118 domain-containing protein [Chloroflexota bacterium]|nr:MAG: DUF4118 domain-containing protein [Chloroflexota bacterium]
MHSFGELRLFTRLDRMRVAALLVARAPLAQAGVRNGVRLIESGGKALARFLPGSALSLLSVALTAGIIWLVQSSLNTPNLSLIYLVTVLLAAALWGLWPGLLAAVSSVVLFEFFAFPGGHNSLPFSGLQDWVTLGVFVGAAGVTDHLATRARLRTEEANRRQEEIGALYDLSTSIISNAAVETILPTTAQKVAELFAVRTCSIMLANARNELEVRAVYPADLGESDDLARPQEVVTGWVYRHGTPVALNGHDSGFLRTIAGMAAPESGASSSLLLPQRAIYAPLTMNNRPVGVMFVGDKLSGEGFSQDDLRALAAFANHAAMALERARLLREAMDAGALRQLDELKSALLSAVSHDLKTPLASIKASVTSLLQPDMEWDASTQREFLEEINEETDRLTRLVSNILDMSRIDAGVLDPQRDWYDLGEVVETVLDRLSNLTRQHRIRVEIEDGLPFAPFDYVQIDQVLTNLLENAVKYSPSRSEILIRVGVGERTLTVSVQDQGSGIPEADVTRIFDKFYRVAKHRSRLISGTGMGLAICRGIVEAHGGRIWVENLPGAGACFSFTLPLDDRAPAPSRGTRRLSTLQRITFGA